ncbi:MAG: hypothetical protein GX489_00280 [Firmicutes bacterium]|nr:hypothetical protein [Bacillota bacterium]
MEKKDTPFKRRLDQMEDEEARIEGIFEEEIMDSTKQCREAAAYKKLNHAQTTKEHKNKART